MTGPRVIEITIVGPGHQQQKTTSLLAGVTDRSGGTIHLYSFRVRVIATNPVGD